MSAPFLRGLVGNFSKISINLGSGLCLKPNPALKCVQNGPTCRKFYKDSFAYNLSKFHQEVIDDKFQLEAENKITKDLILKVNHQINNNEEGRLFAVVQITGKQFKITAGDIIIIEGYWPPTAGDELNLEKVLLIGSSDFSLVGRPLIEPGLAQIKATVIEKTISHTKTHFRKKKRKQYMRINFYRVPQTMLRINSIELLREVNNPRDIEGLDDRIY